MMKRTNLTIWRLNKFVTGLYSGTTKKILSFLSLDNDLEVSAYVWTNISVGESSFLNSTKTPQTLK